MPYNLKFTFAVLLAVCSVALRAEANDPVTLESRDLVMTVEKTTAPAGEGFRLVSLKDRTSGFTFCELPSLPLFSLVVCDVATPETRHDLLADAGWNAVFVQRQDAALHVTWSGHKNIPGAERLVVEMRIVATPDKDGIEISQSAQANSDRLSILSMRLGQIAVRDFGTDMKLFYPYRSGLVIDNPCGKRFNRKCGYPGFDVSMPWFVVWNEKRPEKGFRNRENVGLYLGIHDREGSRKEIACTARRQDEREQWSNTVDFQTDVQAENMYRANNELSIGGKAVLRTVRNDWYDGARIYRDWVRREAKWYPRDKMDENGRTDAPQWLKEHCLWAMYRVNPDEMIPAMQKMRDAFGVPAAVHWYYWHKNPYDNDYPHFFPRDGFGESVAEMQQAGDIFIMPYTNGLLWDSRDRGLEDWLFTKEALPGTVKTRDGKALLHSYGSKESDGSDVKLAHMCPTTEVWQRKVRENTLRLMNEYGVKAVYIDQVGAAIPELCFDESHGHPLGGGHWWGDGYREMLETIRRDMRTEIADHPFCEAVKQRLQAKPDALYDRAITTECTAETCLDVVDGYLTWHHQVEGQVPAFAAVYGGAVQMIGRDYRAGKTYAERTEPRMTVTNEPLACRMKSAEALCFGEQIGWFVPTIINEADKFPFQRKIVRLRHQLRHYFYKGEMCRPPELPVDLPTVTADWNYYDSPLITAAAIQAGCWKIVRDGQTQSAVLIFANSSDKLIRSRIHVDLAELGFDAEAKKPLTIRQYGPEGVEKELDVNALNGEIDFPAEGVFAWEISIP